MYYSIHADFILTPIREILVEGINACKSIGNGVETQPLCEYILSSLFLRLTGAQEQKLKCICWEIATHDYEFRRLFIKDKSQLGECSDYKAKNRIYTALLEQICSLDKMYTIEENFGEKLIDEIVAVIKNLFEGTNVSAWRQRDFFLLEDIRSRFNKKMPICNNKSLFGKDLQEDYNEIVYAHRNRLAHNTTSYQRHLPRFETMKAEEYHWHNYPYRYFLLVLIDSVFIKLYKDYQNGCKCYF